MTDSPSSPADEKPSIIIERWAREEFAEVRAKYPNMDEQVIMLFCICGAITKYLDKHHD